MLTDKVKETIYDALTNTTRIEYFTEEEWAVIESQPKTPEVIMPTLEDRIKALEDLMMEVI